MEKEKKEKWKVEKEKKEKWKENYPGQPYDWYSLDYLYGLIKNCKSLHKAQYLEIQIRIRSNTKKCLLKDKYGNVVARNKKELDDFFKGLENDGKSI